MVARVGPEHGEQGLELASDIALNSCAELAWSAGGEILNLPGP
jgi:hypothetical protein